MAPPEQLNSLKPESRSFDLAYFSYLSQISLPFLVTGSWGIEAVSQTSLLIHEDIDLNCPTDEMELTIDFYTTLLTQVNLYTTLIKKLTPNLLYADLQSSNFPGLIRKLEIKYIPIVNNTWGSNVLAIKARQGRIHDVPLTTNSIMDPNGHEHPITTKSLPHQIATWIIRIFGSPTNPRRQVIDRDISHLRILLDQSYNPIQVIHEMQQHPQMPPNQSASDIFQSAINSLSLSI